MPRLRSCVSTISLALRLPNRESSHTPNFIIAMMAHQITLIPGDGIGPEVADATVRAVDATGVAIEWERVEAGARALAEQGQLIPDEVFASLEVDARRPERPHRDARSPAATRASTSRCARSSGCT